MRKILNLPLRFNLDPDFQLETIIGQGLEAGADSFVLEQYANGIPFFGRPEDPLHPYEIALRTRIQTQVDRIQEAGGEVGFAAQNFTKNPYGDVTAIPTRTYKGGIVSLRQKVILSRGQVYTQGVELPEDFRLYEVWLYVRRGHVRLDWMWHEQERKALFYAGLTARPVIYRLTVHSLDRRVWGLRLAASEDSEVDLAIIRERVPLPIELRSDSQPLSGWVNFIGRPADRDEAGTIVPGTGTEFLHCRSPRLENRDARRKQYQITDRIKEAFPSCDYFRANLDEAANVGWEATFLRQEVSSGAALAKDLVEFACHQFALTGRNLLADADMFVPGHNGNEYSRTCNPRNGGFADALKYIPVEAPIDLLYWNEMKDTAEARARVAADMELLRGRSVIGCGPAGGLLRAVHVAVVGDLFIRLGSGAVYGEADADVLGAVLRVNAETQKR